MGHVATVPQYGHVGNVPHINRPNRHVILRSPSPPTSHKIELNSCPPAASAQTFSRKNDANHLDCSRLVAMRLGWLPVSHRAGRAARCSQDLRLQGGGRRQDSRRCRSPHGHQGPSGCGVDSRRRPALRRSLGGAEDIRDLCRSEGYALVSLDYRLAPEVKLPGIIDDVNDAFRWLRTQGPEAASHRSRTDRGVPAARRAAI